MHARVPVETAPETRVLRAWSHIAVGGGSTDVHIDGRKFLLKDIRDAAGPLFCKLPQ